MIRNLIKIAWRNIWKNKLFSTINVISLAIGLSASFVIGLMVYYDFTFDKFHKDADLIYRITTVYSSPEGEDYNYGVSVPLIGEVKQNITGIQQSTAFFTAEPSRVMNLWLQDFSYRIQISWEILAFSVFLVVLNAILTISHQSIKGAIANPVHSLRSE